MSREQDPVVEQQALRARRDPADGFRQAQSPLAQAQSPAAANPQPEPLLSVTHGNPTAEELAAVTAVVLALQGGQETAPKRPAAQAWARRAQLHLPPRPGAGAWRRSGR
ncbi:hypothetical protein QO003_003680 [Arthrobacter silviterrae]|uniref:acyl-CoA carboxylase subunit epsilon n=1 Tax=Arthrobacter silviterrae TaxID=2026658 RepID=UPI00278330B9|nr:acyl-CoA carboxylase subunit epsilon [Arthrobacter silviterrae]MDQ0279377.1 hypothetical protein [Arthrobacter silviterrae]